MKTIDRKDLKTNELSQQLDHISVYAKDNAMRIAMWVGGAIVLAVIVFAFMNNRSAKVEDAWAKLGATQKTEPADQIKEAREVAEAEINASLTTQAWLRVGVIAMAQLSPMAAPATTTLDWAKTAEEAFTKALNVASNDTTARGQALMGLGVLAENRGDAKASSFYKQITDDRRFDGTPFKAEAEFRLKGVDAWLQPVVIAPAPPPVPEPQPEILGPVLPDMIPVDSPDSPPGGVVIEVPPSSTEKPATTEVELTPAPEATPPSEAPPAGEAPPATTPPADAP